MKKAKEGLFQQERQQIQGPGAKGMPDESR